MRPLEGYDAVMQFAKRRGPATLRLALHASIPQGFRPELMHLLRLNFVPEAGHEAEADVLFAPFTEDMGSGYFEFDPAVRRLLLENLDPTYPQESTSRVRRVAGLLAAHVEQQSSRFATDDRVFSGYLEIQRWVALGFLDPDSAAHQLAAAIAKSSAVEVVARVQLSGLTQALSEPLVRYPKLLAYAAGMEALERGQTDEARELLGRFGDNEVSVGPVILPSPQKWLTGASERRLDAAPEPPTLRELQPGVVGLAFVKEDAQDVGGLVRRMRVDYGISLEASPSLETEAAFQVHLSRVRGIGGKLIVILPEVPLAPWMAQFASFEDRADVSIVRAGELQADLDSTVERLAQWLQVSDSAKKEIGKFSRVFLSSVGRDTKEYRRAAFQAIQGLGMTATRMEDWSASSYSPMDLVRREIAGCDVLVGIYGENYGSIDAESQKSYAELEFDEAVHLGKPVLCFLCRSSHDVQSPSDRQRMQAFLNRLSTGRVVKRVETPEELAIAVVQSLHVLETERNPGGRSQASYSTGAAAEFRYHAYISYQRGDATRRFVDIFIQDLRNELELYLPQPQMFLDYQRLSGSENYNTATSTAICQSISFIAIITPAYFLSEFAGREWAAFEYLDRRRSLAPGYTGIIPVMLRRSESVPENVARFDWFDLSDVASRPNARRSKTYRNGIERIAQRIVELAKLLKGRGIGPDCTDFRLPDKSAFTLQPPPGLAGRE